MQSVSTVGFGAPCVIRYWLTSLAHWEDRYAQSLELTQCIPDVTRSN